MIKLVDKKVETIQLADGTYRKYKTLMFNFGCGLTEMASLKIENVSGGGDDTVSFYYVNVFDKSFPLTNIWFVERKGSNIFEMRGGIIPDGKTDYVRQCLKEYTMACDVLDELNDFIENELPKYIQEA